MADNSSIETGKSCLYVIELEPGKDPNAKWYVGISSNPDRRYQQHRCGGGAEWTRRNEVVDCYKISWHFERHVRKLERHLTAVLADVYGARSTRGAKYLAKDTVISCPKPDTKAMPPNMAQGLRETGNEELARIATKPRIYLSIEEEFRSTDEAYRWGEESLDGEIEVTITRAVEDGTVMLEWRSEWGSDRWRDSDEGNKLESEPYKGAVKGQISPEDWLRCPYCGNEECDIEIQGETVVFDCHKCSGEDSFDQWPP